MVAWSATQMVDSMVARRAGHWAAATVARTVELKVGYLVDPWDYNLAVLTVAHWVVCWVFHWAV